MWNFLGKKQMLSHDVQPAKKNTKKSSGSQNSSRNDVGHHAFQSFQQLFPFTQNGTPLGLQMHLAAL